MTSSRRGQKRSRRERPQVEGLESRRMLDASGLFDPPINETLAVNPRAIAVADLDGDGDDDQAIAHGAGLLVRLNDGSGDFSTGDAHVLNPGLNRLLIADLNGDGVLDLAGSTTTEGGARLFAGVGDGTFTLLDSVDLSGIPTEIAAADIDGDGDPDLLVPILTGNAVQILLNDGDGDFTATGSPAPGASFPIGVVAADFGHGSMRIASAGLGDSQIVLAYEFPALPGIWLQDTAYAVGAQPQTLASADLDGDGDLDLITGDQFGDGLALLFNNGDGTFADYVPLATPEAIGSLALHDLNGDGELDIVAGSLGESTVYVLLGAGGGSFTAPTTFSVGFGVEEVAVGDADNDRFDDIIVVGGSKVAYLYNTTEAPAAPTQVDLVDDADHGSSNSDNLTNLNNAAGNELTFTVSGVEIGLTVRVYAGDTLIAEGVADATIFTLAGNGTALADGYHSITATQMNGANGVESERSAGLTLQIDTVGPVFTSAAAVSATADTPLSFNVESDAEAQGATYTLVSGPAGLTLAPTTGVLSWNASMLQLGNHAAVVSVTDAAGNVAEQTITISVSAGAARPDVISTIEVSGVYATLVPGDRRARAVVNVGNQGNGDARGRITITIYASADQAIGGGDIVLGQISSNLNVRVGQTKGYRVNLTVPGAAAAGTYYLLADVNSAEVAGERRTGNDDAAAATTTDIAWRFGSFEDRRNVRLTVPGPGGAEVTFKMNGSGYGEITGGSAFTTITLTGVNNDKLIVQAAGNAGFTLNDVTINGSLGMFKANSATFAGTLTATGPIARAQWLAVTGTINVPGIGNLRLDGDTSGDWNITGGGVDVAMFRGSFTGGTFTVTAGEARNFKIDGLVSAASTINLNAANRILLRGDSAGVWNIAQSVNVAMLSGSVSGGSFSVGTGETRMLRINGSVAAAATLDVNALRVARIGGDLLCDLTLSYVNVLLIGGHWSGRITTTLTTGQGMGRFIVKGPAVNATLDSIGGISMALFGDVTNVALYAGVNTGTLAAPGELPTAFVNNAEISRLTIRGTINGATIAGRHLENLALGPVSALNPLKIAASTANRVQMTLDGTRYRFSGAELFEQTPALPYLVVEQV